MVASTHTAYGGWRCAAALAVVDPATCAPDVVPPETADALPEDTPEDEPPSDDPLEAEPDWLEELLPPLELELLEPDALLPPETEPPTTPTELGPELWIDVDWVEESPFEDELLVMDVLPPDPVLDPLDC